MKNYFLLILSITGLSLLAGCDKYKSVDPAVRISGHVKLHDTLGLQFPQPLGAKPVYLNQGTDVSSYLLQTTTDSAGYFTFNYINQSTSVAYVRYPYSGTTYFGQVQINAKNKNNVLEIEVYPSYYNGVSLLFTDSYKTPISNLNFRLYTSYLYAVADSTKHAYLNGTSTAVGIFTQYNVPANTYFIVANDIVAGKSIKALDTLVVNAKGIFRHTTIVQ